MTSDERWFLSHLRELGEAECLELWTTTMSEEWAYCDDLGPVALPVNYARDQGAILIQTSPHSTLASRLRAAPASFQIDEFDEYTQTGWNVLVRVTPTQHLGPPTPARLIPPASDLRLA